MYWNFENKNGYSHVKNKYKHEQLMEGNPYTEKFTEIERENRILLEKMHRIMQKHEKPSKPQDKVSLNYRKRKSTYDRINKENKSIYTRLVNKQSAYSRQKYASDRKVIENRLAMISNHSLKPTPRRAYKRLSEDLLDLKYLVLKQSIKLKTKIFLIEIYKYPQDLKILAFDTSSSDIFRLVLSDYEAEEFIGDSEDYYQLLEALNIEGDCLTLTYSS